jgi:hypothetical protein
MWTYAFENRFGWFSMNAREPAKQQETIKICSVFRRRSSLSVAEKTSEPDWETAQLCINGTGR